MRIGINISSRLHRRLEPLKQHINVSQICREAVEERIRCYERALVSRDDADIVQAMARVWNEEREMRDIVDVDWGMLGCEDAKSWVTEARLKDWDYLHHRQEVIQRQGRPPTDLPPPHLKGVKGFNDRFVERKNRIQQQSDQFLERYFEHYDFDVQSAERDYMSAWLAYTDAVWGLFREMQRQYLEERSRRAFNVDSIHPNPALPDNLKNELN